MATKLDKVLKREIEIDGQAYIAAISPEGVKVTKKGFRKGNEPGAGPACLGNQRAGLLDSCRRVEEHRCHVGGTDPEIGISGHRHAP